MTEQVLVTLNVSPAVEAELRRIVVDTERVVGPGGDYRSYRPWVYRIIRDAVPGMTRALWREWAGREPDLSQEPGGEQHAREQYIRDHALLRHHGRPTCCRDCDRDSADVLRLELAGRGEPTEAPEYQAPTEAPVEPVQERTCECDDCIDDRCQGDCDHCDDHGCEQCYGDHNIYDCCGYCEDCDTHPDSADSPHYHRCESCDHCSDCDHYCR